MEVEGVSGREFLTEKFFEKISIDGITVLEILMAL